MPSRSLMEGAQPSLSMIIVLSEFRPLTPFGASRLCVRSSLMPAISSTMSTRPLMVVSSSDPRLMGSRMSLLRMSCVPLTQSSMYMNERV